MAKDSTPVTPTKRRARGQSATPSKQAKQRTPRKQATEPEPDVEHPDEWRWRASWVWEKRTISKGNITKLYRLSGEWLKGLEYEVKPSKHRLPNGQLTVMHLYLEQEVERRAWRKHGGPQAFERYLTNLSNRKEYQSGEKVCPVSKDYIHILIRNGSRDLFVRSSTLAALKKQMVERAHGSDWLWEACNMHMWCGWATDELDDRVPSVANSERYIAATLRDLPPYPPRTAPPEPLPPAFVSLKGVLAVAPVKGDWGFLSKHEENATYDEDPCSGDSGYFWSQEYFTRVFEALMQVINDHGVGEGGWEAARWLAYDAYTKSRSGIVIGEMSFTAKDNAYAFLHGRLGRGVEPDLAFSLFDEYDHPPPIWKKYNA